MNKGTTLLQVERTKLRSAMDSTTTDLPLRSAMASTTTDLPFMSIPLNRFWAGVRIPLGKNSVSINSTKGSTNPDDVRGDVVALGTDDLVPHDVTQR
ncbi:hypothetical protein GYH30_047680 [Glycine max]|nr:hypothetical protein GYH30_047680 [Glycine max]